MSLPSNQMVPLRRREQPADEVEEGGLAGAVGADHRAQFALLDREGDILDRDQAAEGPGDAARFEQAHGVCFRLMAPSTPRGKNTTVNTKKRPRIDIQ